MHIVIEGMDCQSKFDLKPFNRGTSKSAMQRCFGFGEWTVTVFQAGFNDVSTKEIPK